MANSWSLQELEEFDWEDNQLDDNWVWGTQVCSLLPFRICVYNLLLNWCFAWSNSVYIYLYSDWVLYLLCISMKTKLLVYENVCMSTPHVHVTKTMYRVRLSSQIAELWFDSTCWHESHSVRLVLLSLNLNRCALLFTLLIANMYILN